MGLKLRVVGTSVEITKAYRGRAGKRNTGSKTGCDKGAEALPQSEKSPHCTPPSHFISSKPSASQPVRLSRGRCAANLQAVDLKNIPG